MRRLELGKLVRAPKLLHLALALLAARASVALAASAPEAQSLELLTSDTPCPAQLPVLNAIASGPEKLYFESTVRLRQAALENPGKRHRERALFALRKVIIARQQGTTVSDCKAPEASAAKTPMDLLSSLERSSAPGGAGTRLLEANALALTGTVPTSADIAKIVKVIDRETNLPAQLEEYLVLAAFAERSRGALQILRERLLLTADCTLAEQLALSLPSHDLRLALYKSLASVSDTSAKRAADLKHWLRSQNWARCER